jgi:hypothetical protein
VPPHKQTNKHTNNNKQTNKNKQKHTKTNKKQTKKHKQKQTNNQSNANIKTPDLFSDIDLFQVVKVANSAMFSLAVSGSVPNSILFELHESLMLTHLVIPSDLPADSALGLDTNSLASWLSTIPTATTENFAFELSNMVI